MHKALFILVILCPAILYSAGIFAADDKTKNATTQQVGGLLFDVDEGVKIEHGPGGSVYLKSNREFMQEKFKSLDEKVEAVEKRLGVLEAEVAKIQNKKGSPPVSGGSEDEPEAPSPASDTGKRVLVT